MQSTLRRLKPTTLHLLQVMHRQHPYLRQYWALKDIAEKAHLCHVSTCRHLHVLESLNLIRVDRTERPHSYELTGEALFILSLESQYGHAVPQAQPVA